MRCLLFIILLVCTSFSSDTTIHLDDLPVHGELWINSRTDYVPNEEKPFDLIKIGNLMNIKRYPFCSPLTTTSPINMSGIEFEGEGIIEIGYKNDSNIDTLNMSETIYLYGNGINEIRYNKKDTFWNNSTYFPEDIYKLDTLKNPYYNETYGLGLYYSLDFYDNYHLPFYQTCLLDNYNSIIYVKFEENIIMKIQLTDTRMYEYIAIGDNSEINDYEMLSDIKCSFTIAEGNNFPLITDNTIGDNFNKSSIGRINNNFLYNIKRVYAFDASDHLLFKSNITKQNAFLNDILYTYRRLPQNILFFKIITDDKRHFIKVNNLSYPK